MNPWDPLFIESDFSSHFYEYEFSKSIWVRVMFGFISLSWHVLDCRYLLIFGNVILCRYLECFASGVYNDGCDFTNYSNNGENNTFTQEAVEVTLAH